MKVIFLDVDNVLNNKYTKTMTPQGYRFVDDNKILLLKELIEESGAKIVLSSTWREGWADIDSGDENSGDAKDFLMLREKLSEYGVEMIDYTPLMDPEYRGTTIAVWLEKWEGEKIESILILDNDDDIKPFGNFFLKTSDKYGLVRAHVKRGIKMLNEMKYDGIQAEYKPFII